jgi:predicted nucleic acid-binding protein
VSLVAIDASVGVSWVVKAQATPAADALLRQPSNTYVAPALFYLEVQNAVLMLERRQRIDRATADAELSILRAQGIEIEPAPGAERLAVILDLARAQGLTVYDGAYLELAARRNLALASRDRDLLAAASVAGVTAHDLR